MKPPNAYFLSCTPAPCVVTKRAASFPLSRLPVARRRDIFSAGAAPRRDYGEDRRLISGHITPCRKNQDRKQPVEKDCDELARLTISPCETVGYTRKQDRIALLFLAVPSMLITAIVEP